jgi:hypothetical protein
MTAAGLRLRVIALRPVHNGQGIEGDGVIWVICSEPRLDRDFELLRFDQRSGIVARSKQLTGSPLDRAEIGLLRRGRRQSDDQE